MDNLGWGLQITVLGMGIVFSLLALLWGVLTLVMRFDRPAARPGAAPPDTDAAMARGGAVRGLPSGMPPLSVHRVDGMDADLVAAIVVATLVHKAKRRQEAAPAMRTYWPGSLLYASRWLASGRMRQNMSWQRRGR
jgi:Na+-transporting methylmalonyl-CoA/oxaloacetate decarboxylase gamma subunit